MGNAINEALEHAIMHDGRLGLPRRAVHFVSDIHGEAQAFEHLMRSRSGEVRRVVERVLAGAGAPDEINKLLTLIYYPAEVVERAHAKQLDTPSWWRDKLGSLAMLVEILQREVPECELNGDLAGTPMTPQDAALARMVSWSGAPRARLAFASAVDALIAADAASETAVRLASWVRRLCAGPLHFDGDIWDRGAHGDDVMDTVMSQPEVDVQWGNHDVCWMGAAAGDPVCIATCLRNNIKYSNIELFEQGYGISFDPLRELAKNYKEEDLGWLTPLMKAISSILFKAEGQAIMRHPEWHMESRMLFGAMDLDAGTVPVYGQACELRTVDFPFFDPADPYAFSEEEAAVIAYFVDAFRACERLQRQVQWLYDNGGVYKVDNGFLIYHGCVPMEEDGTLAQVDCGDRTRAGRELLDWTEGVCRRAWEERDQASLDWMGFLWCGWQSTFAGRIMKTFERTYIEDEATWKEPDDPYYPLTIEDPAPCELILREFGVDPVLGRIVNGHTPVKLPKGQKPVRAGGKRIVIDGGFCKAYRKSTGIAGYTLIDDCEGLRLITHDEFPGLDAVLGQDADMGHTTEVLQANPAPLTMAMTDEGRAL